MWTKKLAIFFPQNEVSIIWDLSMELKFLKTLNLDTHLK